MNWKKFFLLFLLISVRILSWSQSDKNSPAIYSSVPGVEFLTNDSPQDKIGVYRLGGSLSGLLLLLDSTMHFQKRSYECIGGGIIDSGVWLVYKTGRIGLRTNRGVETFDLIKFNHFYFCIPATERTKFVDDLLRSQAKFKTLKSTRVGDSAYTANDCISYSLMESYYTRQPKALLHRY